MLSRVSSDLHVQSSSRTLSLSACFSANLGTRPISRTAMRHARASAQKPIQRTHESPSTKPEPYPRCS
ncbi:hypothetical protein V6Z11_A10G206600 [Gossypium hirsutum]